MTHESPQAIGSLAARKRPLTQFTARFRIPMSELRDTTVPNEFRINGCLNSLEQIKENRDTDQKRIWGVRASFQIHCFSMGALRYCGNGKSNGAPFAGSTTNLKNDSLSMPTLHQTLRSDRGYDFDLRTPGCGRRPCGPGYWEGDLIADLNIRSCDPHSPW